MFAYYAKVVRVHSNVNRSIDVESDNEAGCLDEKVTLHDLLDGDVALVIRLAVKILLLFVVNKHRAIAAQHNDCGANDYGQVTNAVDTR